MTAPEWFKRPIIFGVGEKDRETLEHVQRVLRCNVTGIMDTDTRTHLRGFQALMGLRPTGVLDEQTACALERIRSMHSV